MSAHILRPNASDIEKARGIVRKHAPFVGGPALLEDVTKAVADGIVLGREEALRLSIEEQTTARRATGVPQP